MPKEHKTDSKETKSQSAKSKTLPDNAKKERERSSEDGTSGHKQCKLTKVKTCTEIKLKGGVSLP